MRGWRSLRIQERRSSLSLNVREGKWSGLGLAVLPRRTNPVAAQPVKPELHRYHNLQVLGSYPFRSHPVDLDIGVGISIVQRLDEDVQPEVSLDPDRAV